jgi:hypothetical protein
MNDNVLLRRHRQFMDMPPSNELYNTENRISGRPVENRTFSALIKKDYIELTQTPTSTVQLQFYKITEKGKETLKT